MNKITIDKIIWSVSSLAFMFLSGAHRVFAQTTPGPDDLVVCYGTPESPCGFPELILTVDRAILFILKFMILPIAVVIFAYGGFLYMTSGGNAGNRTKANRMFKYLGIGLFVCLAAWVIVKIILTTLGYDDTTFSPVIAN